MMRLATSPLAPDSTRMGGVRSPYAFLAGAGSTSTSATQAIQATQATSQTTQARVSSGSDEAGSSALVPSHLETTVSQASQALMPSTLTHRVRFAMVMAGALTGLFGAVAPAHAATLVPQPALASQTQVLSSSSGLSTAGLSSTTARFAAERASTETHLIANVDATEINLEPFATQNLDQFQLATAKSDGHLTVDVQVERNADPMQGGRIRLGPGVPRSSEAPWSGRHTLHMQNGQRRTLSETSEFGIAPEQLGHFLGDHMQAYAEGNTVVEMTGHGLHYRAMAGMPATELGQALTTATTQAGRPIDVLVLESCLSANVEAIHQLQGTTRYALVSEDNLEAGAVARVLVGAEKATAGKALTPRELATRMLHEADGMQGVHTLSLVDVEQLPSLDVSLDHLGNTLLAEVQAGRRTPIDQAVERTAVFPKDNPEVARALGVGDLKLFAQNLLAQYAGQTSPEAQAITKDAQAVLQALDQVVPARDVAWGQGGLGGLSIQLPARQLPQAYSQAHAPAGWKAFVQAASRTL